ncbi:MAG TPA: methyltransferase domain-containing protein [Candidatus Acidoferrales bacterium]|nr:methyltransferase domain-containing protein [Candidatus Acidoferrales bacterium]
MIVGGSLDDAEALRQAGFGRIVNSNFPGGSESGTAHEVDSTTERLPLDAEAMDLADDSFDLVFAHEVLHHCRSPHRALCEMLRVCRRHAVLLEPNESLAMSALTAMGFSSPYELTAVAYHLFVSGGVRESAVPNFIYRWNRREVLKTVSSFMPERTFSIDAYPYWDFNATELDLELKKETRIGSITAILGASNFLSFLRFVQFFLNQVPIVRRQGNKFFCCIEKQTNLQPWLAREGDRIVFRRPSSLDE